MTKIFLDNYGLVTTPYFGKDGYAVIGLSDRGYRCLQRFLESEEFNGTLNKILSEVTTMETDVDGIKFVMVLDKTSFLYVIGCLNTSVLFMDEPFDITDVCQVVFQQVTLDSYKPNEAEHNYHLFSICRDIYKFSYRRDKDKIDKALVRLAYKGEDREPSTVWHSTKPDVTSSNELLVKLAVLEFKMTESELSDALVALTLNEAETGKNAIPLIANAGDSDNVEGASQENTDDVSEPVG